MILAYALRTHDDVGLQTVGAYVESFRGTVYDCFNGTNVGLPHFVGPSMRMADFDAKVSAFITNITSCHDALHLLLQYFAPSGAEGSPE